MGRDNLRQSKYGMQIVALCLRIPGTYLGAMLAIWEWDIPMKGAGCFELWKNH